MKKPRILMMDIETSLMKVELPVFSLFGPKYISHKHVKEDWYIISIAWRWKGQKKIHSVSVLDDPKRFKKNPKDDKYVIEIFSKEIEKADMVVGHNLKAFDLKKFNARVILNKMKPLEMPVAYDTLKVARKIASFSSNRLDFLGPAFGYKGKTESEGLWDAIHKANGNAPNEIKKMVKYNKNDIDILDYVFDYVLPHGPAIPALILNNKNAKEVVNCVKCGSDNTHKYGTMVVTKGRFQKHRCNNCGGITIGKKVNL